MWPAALVLSLVLISGCSSWRYDLGEPLVKSKAVVGEASLSMVLRELGPPLRISSLPGGYVMAWEHWLVQERSLGLSLGPVGIDLLAIDWGGAHISGELLLLSFDLQHQLTDSSFSQWDESAGGGRALQPSLGLVDVVDVSDLVGIMPQHRWGATALQVPPRSLNAQSSPDSGESGLEQRGSPNGAGQRTLELQD